ncbi:MAG: LuxR C-terminal-related transcriptional regulator [Solirubrobacteraceae bacterium]
MSATIERSAGIVPPLAARLAPPRLEAGRVRRERLMRRLRSVPDPAVQVVHAPPGYGKSTLVAQLAQAEEREVVWLTLNERDGDPVTFVADLVFALGDDDDAAAELLESLAAGPATIVPSALPRLIRMLDEHHDALIVLDDVHLAASPGAGDVVRALVDHVPAGSTLVLAGRVCPDLPVPRLKAAGHLAQIDARDLRMTVAEGAAMVRDHGVVLDQHAAELVVRRTEGWPAALYLFARAAVDNAMEADDVPQRTGDGLDDYFREEVLNDVDPRYVRFLLDSSILEDLHPADCDAILDRSDSARQLESLADADLFVESLDAHGDGYRVHGLFREALLHRLRRSDPERADWLNQRAAEHYMQRGEIELAVLHALAAGEGKMAADLVWCTAPAYEAQGRSATLKRWLEWFSPAQFDENPCLALAAGWVAIDDGDGDAAEHWTTVALAAPPDIVLADEAPMGAAAQLLDAALGKHGVRAVREAAASADDLLPQASPWRAAAKLLGGAAAYAAADRETARSLLLDAQARGASFLPAVYKLSLGELALMAIDEDDWEEAESCMARARLTETHGLRDYATQSICSAVNALIHAHRGEPIAARGAVSDAKRALAAQRRYGTWFAAQGRLILSAAFVELDALAEARMMLSEARALVHGDADAAHLHRWAEELARGLEGRTGSLPEGEALSIAELRTLQYLQTHLTQREIADRLFLSRNTIKTHTGALYRKLAVTSRSAAVERGRELGLLEGP